jgi:hypothetical protein
MEQVGKHHGKKYFTCLVCHCKIIKIQFSSSTLNFNARIAVYIHTVTHLVISLFFMHMAMV